MQVGGCDCCGLFLPVPTECCAESGVGNMGEGEGHWYRLCEGWEVSEGRKEDGEGSVL